MRLPLLLFLLLMCSIITVHAQVQPLSGMVTAGQERIGGALIYNTQTHILIVSNFRGEFYMKAQPGDTLITSKPDYINDTLIVATQSVLIINLKKPVNQLKEVVIRGNKPSPQVTYEQNKKDFKEIYRIGDNKKIVVITPLGPGIRIDPLYSALSREGKNARKLQRKLTTEYKNSVIDQRFTKRLVTRITGYKDEKLQDFMYKCRPNYEMATTATDYELIRYIKQRMMQEQK